MKTTTQKAKVKMEINKYATKYTITDGPYSINVIVDNVDPTYLDIRTKSGDNRFNFSKSKPETILAIGKLLIEAADLAWEK